VRYFTLRYPPDKQLFFDQVHGVTKLIDDYAELLAKPEKTDDDKQLIELCQAGGDVMVSSIPFSHLVESYQAALKDKEKTLEVLGRTEYDQAVKSEKDIILNELTFIDSWLARWAPQEFKFEILKAIDGSKFTSEQRTYLSELSKKVVQAPDSADGEWFHKTIYELKEANNLSPEDIFKPLYQALIGKDQGPRAGWFLSILPRDWLVRRLNLEA